MAESTPASRLLWYFASTHQAVLLCLGGGHVISAVTLIYSSIDTFGWLASPKETAGRRTFIPWVERFILGLRPAEFTAEELWEARCGIVHTATPSSRTLPGRTRRLCYSYGSAPHTILEQSIEQEGADGSWLAVKVEDLLERWGDGASAFATDLDAAPVARAVAERKLAGFLVYVPLPGPKAQSPPSP